MDLSKWLGIISGLVFAVAYLDYNREVLRRKITPNGATWAIWAVIALISASSYITSVGDFWKSIISILNILLCIGTFVLVLLGGAFTRLDKTDLIALAIGLCAAVVWVVWRSATQANLIVQVAIAIGFATTWRGIWRGATHERPRPWWLWTGCYLLLTLVIILRWKGQWTDLVYPINCFWLHASVPILAYAVPYGIPIRKGLVITD